MNEASWIAVAVGASVAAFFPFIFAVSRRQRDRTKDSNAQD